MKIAFIVSVFPKLSETFVLNQITGFLDMGHDVEIFAASDSEDIKVHSDVEKYKIMKRIHYISMPHNKIKRILKALYLIIVHFNKSPIKILKSINIFKYGKRALSLNLLYWVFPFLDKNFDIILCHFGTNGIIGSSLKEIGCDGKIITIFHGYDMSTSISNNGSDLYEDLFLNGDIFLPISEYWKRKLVKLNCNKKKVAVHHMGINLEKFNYYERRIQSGEPIKILTVGRLVEKKGHEYTIKAIAKAITNHKNIIYLIAGDGPLRNKLESLVSELKITKCIKFLGAVEQDEALKLYQQAHIFVLHSVTASNGDQEGIPVVLMEAQATGLPVISTFHSGIPEVVIDGRSGFLVPEKDVDVMTEKLEYLIEHPEIWGEMGRAGHAYVKKHYDIHLLNDRLVGIYKQLLNQK